MGLTLSQALRFSPKNNAKRKSIAFVGAGGKTTALFQLARQLHPPVAVTATTHFGKWQTSLGDQHIVINSTTELDKVNLRGVTVFTGPIREDDRTEPISQEALYWLHAKSQERGFHLLVEADGSRQRAVKAPAAHEPVIPEFTELVVVLVGLSALGKPLDEDTVHRPEIFSGIAGLKTKERITSRAIANALTHREGGLKNIPVNARRVALLNQADTRDAQASAQNIAGQLLESFDAALVANLAQEHIYAVYEPVAGIILAAGGSKRMGHPKQLLDWRGEPFVRAVVKTAIQAGLSPAIVVTGAGGEAVETAIRDLPVKIIRNEQWQQGQSSSIRIGLQALSSFSIDKQTEHSLDAGAAIFLLADQPQISEAVIHALTAHHATGLHPIVAPLVMMERRANPVLFDKTTFPDLLSLKGDTGGRAIFPKHRVEYLPWHDEGLLFDVDKPEDYPRLKELE